MIKKTCTDSLPLKKTIFYNKHEWQYKHEQYNSRVNCLFVIYMSYSTLNKSIVYPQPIRLTAKINKKTKYCGK